VAWKVPVRSLASLNVPVTRKRGLKGSEIKPGNRTKEQQGNRAKAYSGEDFPLGGEKKRGE